MNRKTQITIETHSITIIRSTGATFNVHCETCQKSVSAFDAEQIAEALKLDQLQVEAFRLSGEIHNTASDNLLLCGNSLPEILRRLIK